MLEVNHIVQACREAKSSALKADPFDKQANDVYIIADALHRIILRADDIKRERWVNGTGLAQQQQNT